MIKRKLLNSPRLLELKKRRRRVFLNKILLSLFSVFAVVGTLVYLSHIKQLNFNQVEVVGNKILDAETIKAAVNQEINGNYLWVFPKTNVLLYPKNKMKNELLDKFTRIKDATFSIKNKRTLELLVTERDPKYLWCGETLNTETEQCYFMDESGYIFDVAPYFSGEVYFKFYGLAHAGSYFAPEVFSKLASLKEILQSIELKPTTLLLTDNGDIHISLSPLKSTTKSPEIILKKDSDFQKTAENLEAALTTEPLQSKFKNNYTSLLYIDLRFGNKVYYKFSNPNVISNPTNSVNTVGQ